MNGCQSFYNIDIFRNSNFEGVLTVAEGVNSELRLVVQRTPIETNVNRWNLIDNVNFYLLNNKTYASDWYASRTPGNVWLIGNTPTATSRKIKIRPNNMDDTPQELSIYDSYGKYLGLLQATQEGNIYIAGDLNDRSNVVEVKFNDPCLGCSIEERARQCGIQPSELLTMTAAEAEEDVTASPVVAASRATGKGSGWRWLIILIILGLIAWFIYYYWFRTPTIV